MILSKQSWHYYVYTRLFSTDPSNLCPYFWKLVLSIILFPILFSLSIPYRIIALLIKDEDWNETFVGEDLGKIILSAVGVTLLVGMIGIFFVNKDHGLFTIGLIGWGLIGIVIVFLISCKVKDKMGSRKPKKKKPGIVKEFIKAKMGKYCPKINWED